jgi:DNA-binding MarR family transcriptional regulator
MRERGPPGDVALPKSNVESWIKPGVDGASLEVDDFLSMRITDVSALLLRVSTRRYLLEHEISLPEWRVLTMLVRYGPGTTRALRDASKMDKGQMSRALMGLEKRKLVHRMKDKTHELRHILEISEEGLALYHRIMPNARRAQVALLKHLTVEERKTLDAVLTRLKAVAESEV